MSEHVTYRGGVDGSTVYRVPGDPETPDVIFRKDVPAEVSDDVAKALSEIRGHSFDVGEAALKPAAEVFEQTEETAQETPGESDEEQGGSRRRGRRKSSDEGEGVKDEAP